jgi:hypothetical protein
MQIQTYAGSVDSPCPPLEPGWLMVEAEDELAKMTADALVDVMPPWVMLDTFLQCGVYRFYSYEHACGRAVGAYRYCGMGAGDDGEQDNPDEVHDPDRVDPIDPNTPKGSGGGPIPQPDDECDAWVPDASNAKAVKMANDISYHNTPVAWTNQTAYTTTIDGARFRFVMYWAPCPNNANAQCKFVSVFKCTKPKKKLPSLSASSSALPWVLAAVAVVLALGGAAVYSQSQGG